MRVAILLATLACASGLIPRHLPTKLNRVVASSEVVAMKHAEQLSVAAAAFLLASTVASQPAFAGDIEAGSGIFSANCAACHAGGNNVIYSAKTLKKEALLEYLSGGYKESSIITQVTNGKNAMPAFGGRLSDEEIQDVAAFVFNQADTGAWDSR